MTSFISNFDSYKGCLPEGLILPEVKIDEKYYSQLKIDKNTSNFDFLKTLCLNGLGKLDLKDEEEKAKYKERLDKELSLFYELGFVDYLLITWDIINFCKESGIPVGLGRGSGAGSLTLFLSGITGIDPIKYDLYFERFVSRARARSFQKNGIKYLDGSLAPDIDTDISYERRQEVIDYIYKKYPDYASSISTYATLSGKLCIKECSKIVGETNEVDAQHTAETIPKIFGKVMPLQKARKESEKFSEWVDTNSNIYNTAVQLEGLIKNTSSHASGIAISRKKIQDISPITLDEGTPVSVYEMDTISEMMIKVDILGLRTLSVIDDACKRIGIDWKTIDIDHESIYLALQDLDSPKGIFQIEADATYQVCRKVKPANLQELSDVIALSRPGALAYVDDYVAIKDGLKIIPERHKILDDILRKTKGIIIYQESMMKIAHEVFGFSLEDAEVLRRIVGKKKRKEVKQWESKIKKQAEKVGIEKSVVDFFWKSVNESADYQFNFSHSLSYATLSAITTYIKFNYPQAFFISLLKMSQSEPKPHEEIRTISNEVKRFGIKLLPPDLALSKMDFTIEDKDIRYGLSSIKGVSDKSLQAVIDFRNSEKPNKFEIFLSAKEAGLNIGILSALIQAGAISGYRQKRSRMVFEAQCFNILTDREKRNILRLGKEYDFDLIALMKDCFDNATIADDQKPVFKESRIETIKKKIEPYKEIYSKNSRYEDFANWYFEKELLGYSPSLKLKEIMGEGYSDSSDIPQMKPKQKYKLIGTVTASKKAKSKNKNMYISLDVVDDSGQYRALLCDNNYYEKCSEYINSGKKIPSKNDIVIIIGSSSNDGTIFIDDMTTMQEKIYINLRDLNE